MLDKNVIFHLGPQYTCSLYNFTVSRTAASEIRKKTHCSFVEERVKNVLGINFSSEFSYLRVTDG